MLAVLEPVVGAERAQERLLPGVLGPLAEQPPEVSEHLARVLAVEPFERGDRRHACIMSCNAERADCETRRAGASRGGAA